MPLDQIAFIIDTQLPPVLAAFLKRKGFNATHTSKVKVHGELMSDSDIISFAIEHNLIVVTKDKDFVDYYFAKGFPPKILQLQMGNIKNDDLIDILDVNIDTISKLIRSGHNLIIFNKDSIISY